MSHPTNPFAAAFDTFWNWPVLGQLYQAGSVNLPQLDDLPQLFPDAQNIRIIDMGNQVKFEAPGLGPLGSTVYVCLTSPSIASFSTGFKLCMHIYPTTAARPAYCGLWTTTQDDVINVVVGVEAIKGAGFLTLDWLQALDQKRK
jgi:hypothetical protein